MATPVPRAKTVLLVDDNAMLLQQAETYLTKSGMKVVSHSSPFGVGPLMNQHKPDVAVLDVMMPGLDGEQVFQFLEKQATEALPPVIFYSAMAEEPLHQLCKRRPGTSYVLKSDGLRALHSAIQKLLGAP